MNHIAIRIATSVALACVGAAALSVPGLAQSAKKEREATIIVSGDGSADVIPDIATLTLIVIKQGETAEDTLKANNTVLAQVLANLKSLGIADRDLQTNGFSLQPTYSQTPSGGSATSQGITGYEVSNGLSVVVRDLSKLGDIVDRAVKLGVNHGSQITFSNDKPEAAIASARKSAVVEAINKARMLAEAAGVKIGRVIEISEISSTVTQPMFRSISAGASAGPIPFAAGENSYLVTVNVTFGIKG